MEAKVEVDSIPHPKSSFLIDNGNQSRRTSASSNDVRWDDAPVHHHPTSTRWAKGPPSWIVPGTHIANSPQSCQTFVSCGPQQVFLLHPQYDRVSTSSLKIGITHPKEEIGDLRSPARDESWSIRRYSLFGENRLYS